MCLPVFAAVPAIISAAATGAGAAAGTGTFLGLTASTWGTIGTVAGIAGAATSAVGSIVQGQQQAKTAEANADLANQRALEERRRGSREEGEQRTNYQRFLGTQRAIMGASGVVPDTDSGGDVLSETVAMGERDAQRLRVNAERQAWGYGAEAMIHKYQGSQARTAGYFNAGTTFLGGVNDVLRASPWWKKLWGQPGYNAFQSAGYSAENDYY